jgi:colanic acid biosynthesis glycosyl transferase WcaI
MNYYTIINKWSYTVIAVLIYTLHVQVQIRFMGGIATPNYYFESGVFLFLAYLVAVDFFIPFLTGMSTLEFTSSWRNALRASLIENAISYLILFGFLVMTRDMSVSRAVLGISFLTSFVAITLAHFVIPRLFYDLSNSEFEESQPKKKTVTIWGINYHPEPTGIGPQTTYLAETLANLGYQVTIVTAFSYYPSWAKDARDEGRIFRMDAIRGVTIRRCWLYVPSEPSFIKRVAQQISFVVSSSLQLMFMEAPSFYIGVCPPFTVGPVLRLLSKIKRTPYAIHLQDDEIGAAFETSNLPPIAYERLRQIEKIGFKGAKVLSTISPLMKERLEERLREMRVSNEVIILSNKAHASGNVQMSKVRAFREQFPTRRLLVYSGNLGDKQVLDDFIPVVSAFPKEELMLYICGDGAQKKKLARLVEQHSSENVVFHSLLSDEEHEILLAAADACLLSEKTHKGKWLSPGICFASKLLSYMKHAKPIVIYASQESEVLQIVRNYECGFYLKEEQSIEALLREFIDCENLQPLGISGHVYYESFLSKFKPMTWIALMEQRIAEKHKIEVASRSMLGQLLKRSGEILLRVISIPLAVIVYGILAIPIKAGKKEKRPPQ